MLWQSYPIIWMVLGLVVTVVLLRMVFYKLHRHVAVRTDGKKIPYQRKWFVMTIFSIGLVTAPGGLPFRLRT